MSQIFVTTGGKAITYTCLYCDKDIRQCLRIKCAECNDVNLCGDCFAAGVNINEHKNIHPYFIVDCLEHPIFTKDWTMAEELLLLEGLSLYLCLANNFTILQLMILKESTNLVQEIGK